MTEGEREKRVSRERKTSSRELSQGETEREKEGGGVGERGKRGVDEEKPFCWVWVVVRPHGRVN